MIKKDQHVHLHGVLSAQDLWTIGKDTYKNRIPQLNWYADHYQRAWGRRPQYLDYWQKDQGLEQLTQDYVFAPAQAEVQTFPKFQACFNLIIALCPISPQDFSIQTGIIRKVAAQGLEYFEPRTLIPIHFSAKQTQEYLLGLCQVIQKLNQESSMKTRLVFSLFRESNVASIHYHWLRLFIRQNPHLSENIEGIDFAFNEEGFPPSDKLSLFSQFKYDNQKEKPLRLLYHVGESFENIHAASAVRWIYEAWNLGADRLGHAIALGIGSASLLGRPLREHPNETLKHQQWLKQEASALKDFGYTPTRTLPHTLTSYDARSLEDLASLQKAVAMYLKEKQAIIEVCPSSNLYMGQLRSLSDHPLKFFTQMNLNVLLGTDDPGIFQCDWRSEYKLAKHIQQL